MFETAFQKMSNLNMLVQNFFFKAKLDRLSTNVDSQAKCQPVRVVSFARQGHLGHVEKSRGILLDC
jgi:hypothetical protein